jgi:hypothetical protein
MANRKRISEIPLPKDFSKRKTFSQKLEELRAWPRAEQEQYLAKIKSIAKALHGYRYHDPKTQASQNEHLAQFHAFIAQNHHRTVDGMSAEELENLTFLNPDLKALAEAFRDFLIYYSENNRTSTGDTISHSSLSRVRDSLLFWTQYKRHVRNQDSVPLLILEDIGAQATRAIIEVHPEAANDTPQTMKASLGLAELSQLLNHEPQQTQSIEMLEQH